MASVLRLLTLEMSLDPRTKLKSPRHPNEDSASDIPQVDAEDVQLQVEHIGDARFEGSPRDEEGVPQQVGEVAPHCVRQACLPDVHLVKHPRPTQDARQVGLRDVEELRQDGVGVLPAGPGPMEFLAVWEGR